MSSIAHSREIRPGRGDHPPPKAMAHARPQIQLSPSFFIYLPPFIIKNAVKNALPKILMAQLAPCTPLLGTTGWAKTLQQNGSFQGQETSQMQATIWETTHTSGQNYTTLYTTLSYFRSNLQTTLQQIYGHTTPNFNVLGISPRSTSYCLSI